MIQPMRTKNVVLENDDEQKPRRDTGGVIWLYGLSGAGKTTLAQQAAWRLRAKGKQVVVLDGDELRSGLCRGLAYTEEDRLENVRRAAELARLLSVQGFLVLVALMTPLCRMRELARQIIGSALTTICLCCDSVVCAARDVKGLYRKAATGVITDLPGRDMTFEWANDGELTLDTGTLSEEECLRQLMNIMHETGL